MMMGFFKAPANKKTDLLSVEKDGIEIVGGGKDEIVETKGKGNPNKKTMTSAASEKFWKLLSAQDSSSPLNLKTTKPKGKGKYVAVNVMATVFPPGADPSNPFSIAQPYTEPKTVKVWNRKKLLMFDPRGGRGGRGELRGIIRRKGGIESYPKPRRHEPHLPHTLLCLLPDLPAGREATVHGNLEQEEHLCHGS